MWETWWTHLPGPSAFLKRVEHSLRTGNTVIVAFPCWSPDGFSEHLYRRVARNPVFNWVQMSCSPSDEPASVVASACLDRLPAGESRRASVLALDPAMRETIAFVEDIERSHWESWRAFATEFAETSQSTPQNERGRLCLIIRGVPESELPRNDKSLAVHVWKGQVSDLDMQVFVGAHLADLDMPAVQLAVRRALVSSLAGFDPHTAIALVDRDLGELLAPEGCLREIAQERNWHIECCRQASWEEGMEDQLDGAPMVHSAAVSIDSTSVGELRTRIWSGQVAVLFPLLERKRRAFIEQYGARLRVPLVRPDKTRVERIEEYEFGDLKFELRSRVRRDLLEQVERCQIARNTLAHFGSIELNALSRLLKSLA